jgi:Tol biopolymer transport system component
MTSLEQIIDMNHVGAATAAISARGTDVAFIKNGERTLWAYNLASKSLRKLAEGADYLGGIDFSPDGQTIYYVEQVGAELFELKSVPLAGGGGSSMGVQGYYSELAVDPNGDILLVDISDWPQSRIYRYTPGGGSPEYVTDGSGPSVKCDSSSIIVQRNNSDGSVSLVRRDIPSGTEHLFSSKELYRPDYMPTC